MIDFSDLYEQENDRQTAIELGFESVEEMYDYMSSISNRKDEENGKSIR